MTDPGNPTATAERRRPVARRRRGPTSLARARRDGAAPDGLLFVSEPGGRLPASGRRAALIGAAALILGDVAALFAAYAASPPSDGFSLLYVALALFVLAAASAYRLRINLGALDEAPRLAAALAVPLLVIAPFASEDHRHLLRQALLSVVAIVLTRSFTYGLLRRARRRGLTERTLIAGSGHVGIELAHLMRAHPEYGLDLVGFVGAPFPNLPVPLLGDIAHLDDVVTRHAIRRVLVAFGPTREAELVSVLRTAVLRDVEVHVIPRFFEIGVAPRGPDVDDIWGIPVYRVRQAALRARAWRFKRGLDVVFASAGLVAAAPVMLLAAAAVKASSHGPVLFRQRRIGQHGHEFEVLKFRTLPHDHVDDRWNAADAEYPTGIGRCLRRLSIDELPQLWNVLRGDMSLVGPRPERGYLVEQFNASVYGYRDRHRLPVGLTGWAQVHGLRGETSLRERVRFDNQYIEHWSLWRDLVILVRTASAFFRAPHDMSEPESQLRDASAAGPLPAIGADVLADGSTVDKVGGSSA